MMRKIVEIHRSEFGCDPGKILRVPLRTRPWRVSRQGLAIVFKDGRVSKDDEIAKNVFAGFDREIGRAHV